MKPLIPPVNGVTATAKNDLHDVFEDILTPVQTGGLQLLGFLNNVVRKVNLSPQLTNVLTRVINGGEKIYHKLLLHAGSTVQKATNTAINAATNVTDLTLKTV